MKMDDAFLKHACDILGDTDEGLSGSKIVKFLSRKSVVYNVEIPHSTYPFPKDSVPNKRTALYNNIKSFKESEQYEIIRELCEQDNMKEYTKAQELKSILVSRYGHLAKASEPIIEIIQVEENKHFLRDFSDSETLYSGALTKYSNGVYHRNLLDDLRLSLELFLKKLLGNDKSLENQIADVGTFAKNRGLSNEAVNMFQKLLEYYSKYQNTYVKHNDNVNVKEVEFVITQTSSFMRLFLNDD